MSKHFFAAAFACGLAAVGWVALGFAGTSVLALAVTALIAGVFLLGAFELRQFRASTGALSAALEDVPPALPALGEWMERVPAPLRTAVCLRVEGERVALPGPALTPYLAGLLVMLGMLGTFLGMVLTFKGAVFALEGSADLAAMRAALAEPIKGLGLSFGTSVAGVAASAMLGLMSAIARRERMAAVRLLDARIATVLRPFSRAHQREEALRALQAQSGALPAVADQLGALMDRIDERSRALDAQLLERHERLQGDVTRAYTALAAAVGTSLQESLAAGARSAAETITPVVASAMAQVVDEAQRLHARLGESVQEGLARSRSDQAAAEQQRVQAWTAALHAMAGELQGEWRRVGDAALAQQQAASGVLARSEELVRSRTESEARWVEQQGARMDQLAQLWRTGLQALREDESARAQAAVDRLGELEAAVAQHLATLGTQLEAPITRLLHTAAEVPRAASGVLAQLREETSRLAERDNATLEERARLLEQVGSLLQGLQQHAGQAAQMAVHANASAVELASLGESFGASVQQFQAGNEKLLETLQRIEASIHRSTARSDEQLAYYVAQAREVIDLSIASQQGLVERLGQLQARPVALVAGGRG